MADTWTKAAESQEQLEIQKLVKKISGYLDLTFFTRKKSFLLFRMRTLAMW